MNYKHKINSVAQEAGNGRRFLVVEIQVGAKPITFKVSHINPKRPDFDEVLSAYVDAYVDGLRRQETAASATIVPALTAQEVTTITTDRRGTADIDPIRGV